MLKHPPFPSVVGFMCCSGSPGYFGDEREDRTLTSDGGVVKMTDGEIWGGVSASGQVTEEKGKK